MRRWARVRRRSLGVIGFLLLSACAFTPHNVTVDPKVTMADSDIGNGTRVYFRFVDERDDTVVGHRAAGTMGAKVTADNLPHVVETTLRDGLVKKHFTLSDQQAGTDASVIYRLRSFKFDIETGFFTGGRNSAAALAVEARRGERSYDKVYRFNDETRIVFLPGESEIDQQMNGALSDILDKALSDTDLDRMLAGH